VIALALLGCGFASEPAAASPVTTRRIEHLGGEYTVVTVVLGGEADVRLYGGRGGGLTFEDARKNAERDGRTVLMSTNAGMYDPSHGPVGWFVTGGEERHAIALGDGEGNFHLKPNGVFWMDAAGAHVDVSEKAPVARAAELSLATQSGPMLLIDGAVHPAFRPESSNLLTRSGVGVSADGRTVHFAISENSVRFHDFATLFLSLECEDALFLDGVVSLMWDGQGTPPGARFSGVLSVTAPAR
jgi:uncharacterized protein YigE (DUF2233 family)